jgi:uncharacterized protein
MRHRLISKHFDRLIKQYPVITMTGPRQSGKTTFCRHHCPTYDYVNLEDLENRQHATDDPKGFLAQFNNNVILDEIQRTPDLPSLIQTIVDKNDKPGQFILTGSQQFEVIDAVNQSLAGRTALVKLLPFSLEELYQKKSEFPPIKNLFYTGFYPRIYHDNLNPSEALSFYLHTYIERDVRRLANIKNISAFERFIKICATQVGQLINYSRLSGECGVDSKTIQSWISILKASYLVYELQPHFENFRKRLVKMPKLYFYDVGLVSYLLGMKSPDQTIQHPMKGQLFENLVIGEFIKNRFNNVKDSNLYFFRDNIGNEVDLVLDYGNEIITVEIKSSETISSSYFKALKYYQKLCGNKNTRRIVVYAGSVTRKQQDFEIYSYKDLPILFAELNSIG